MRRYKIVHRTYYAFSGMVMLEPHALRLLPRESHELHVESSNLLISPQASLRWHRDVEDNSVAIASFAEPCERLAIESEVVITQFNETPLDFLVADYAIDYPFAYDAEDRMVLAAYMQAGEPGGDRLGEWLLGLWQPGTPMQSYALLQALDEYINDSISYRVREEPGVQSAVQTLTLGSGSCRDYAYLFIQAARRLGLAARFVSGYLHAPPSNADFGATHAWAEVYLPGAGWKGFDPTLGAMVGSDHIAVAVARSPESVPPVAGAFVGLPGTTMDVGVWVSDI